MESWKIKNAEDGLTSNPKKARNAEYNESLHESLGTGCTNRVTAAGILSKLYNDLVRCVAKEENAESV